MFPTKDTNSSSNNSSNHNSSNGNNKSNSNESISVNESAFWHANMDLFYGYQTGEVVEVEHESNKYWLATIKYSFKHLVLLAWVGNYGEFWVDTAQAQAAQFKASSSYNSASSNASKELFRSPKRLFPLGHHLQSQLKSQFILERPTQVLVEPTLYNPEKDPYAKILTVDDLLACDIDPSAAGDAILGSELSSEARNKPIEPPSVAVLAKCKTKPAYGQEDVDELEAALLNLNDDGLNDHERVENQISTDQLGANVEKSSSPIGVQQDSGLGSSAINADAEQDAKLADGCDAPPSEQSLATKRDPPEEINSSNGATEESSKQETLEQQSDVSDDVAAVNLTAAKSNKEREATPKLEIDHEKYLNLCQELQRSAITDGRYTGLDEHQYKVFFTKPKQFFEIGGANHERVLVPGTILEVAHTYDKPETDVFDWFAYVVKNVGGRLTLRWFLCDEPKFKQGRLELKSSKSEFIIEDGSTSEIPENSSKNNHNPSNKDSSNESASSKLYAKDLTFCLHFCNPRIQTIPTTNHRFLHKWPAPIEDHMEKLGFSDEERAGLAQQHLDYVFDDRRMNLDKDRPLIDHLLSVARWSMPNYLQLVFAKKSKSGRREVLISTPKSPKLYRGFVKSELDRGVFEIHSEPISENGEIIKFVYPHDNSCAILPIGWAANNEDCLSTQPSRNPTPTPSMPACKKNTKSATPNDDAANDAETLQRSQPNPDNVPSEAPATEAGLASPRPPETASEEAPPGDDEPLSPRPYTLMCEIPARNLNSDSILEEESKTWDNDFDKLDPGSWTDRKRARELNATEFKCEVDCRHMEAVISKFKVMDQLEVTHPSADTTICSGRIRKVVYPLIWVQISPDSFTVLPFNSTEIYPSGWCEANNHPLVSLLPPRKRYNSTSNGQSEKKRKKSTKQTNCENAILEAYSQLYDKEHLDLGSLSENRHPDFDYILNEKAYITIYFNHKCFTGPSLSKGKICSLPQCVGPGPMRLVIEEVVTKIISIAYVPPRILNELCSKSFEELLVSRGLTNTAPMLFKAKYQKRVHRETVHVCLSPDDVTLYCKCVCEHLKCCYNLFGPNLYDGDDCPGHCRALTKSNKFMKRATYYREKARLGEFSSGGGSASGGTAASGKKMEDDDEDTEQRTTRAPYCGRGSSGSTCSSSAASNNEGQPTSGASSADDCRGQRRQQLISEASKENQIAVSAASPELGKGDSVDGLTELGNEHELERVQPQPQRQQLHHQTIMLDDGRPPYKAMAIEEHDSPHEFTLANNHNQVLGDLKESVVRAAQESQRVQQQQQQQQHQQSEFGAALMEQLSQGLRPEEWTVDDVAEQLEWCHLGKFKATLMSEGVDGQALLLLDKFVIRDHFQQQQQQSQTKYTLEEVRRLCRFVELVKAHASETVS